MPSAAGLEAVATPTAPATRLRDAVAAARIPPEPASSRTRLDLSDPKRRGLSRIASYVGFDTTRPKVDVPSTGERGLSWIAQHASFDTASPK